MFLPPRNNQFVCLNYNGFLSCNVFKYITRLIGPLSLGVSLVLVSILVLLTLPPNDSKAAPNIAAPFPTQTEALTQALKALVTQYQNADGGYTNFSNGANMAPSSAEGTVDAILAIAGANYNPNIPYPGKNLSPIEWMQANSGDMTTYASEGGGPAGKTVMALVAANQDPTNFAGQDFVGILTSKLEPTGQFTDSFVVSFRQALAIMGLKAAEQTIPVTATAWLTSGQLITGSWDSFSVFAPNGSTDSTAIAIMALMAAGVPTNSPSVVSATNFLSSTQLASGGFEDSPGGPFSSENANSTALAYQALLALGENVGSGGPWDKGGGKTPLKVLLEMQSTSGAFLFFGSDNYFSTAQAIPAVADRIYPIFPKTLTETITPASGNKTLTYDDPSGKSIQIEISDSAVTQTTELRLDPITPLPTTTVPITPATATFSFAGQLFTLKAFQGGVEQPAFNFAEPITVTLIYHDADISVINEDSLQLYYWDGSAWQTDGITIVQRIPDQNKLVVTISHLTDFALFGEITQHYLPLIQKGN